MSQHSQSHDPLAPEDPVHLHTHHITSWQLLTGVLLALLVLTALTVVTARFVHLPGEGNLILALVIAFAKASLVCAFFMHLLHDKAFNSVILFYCLLAIACFLMFTSIDLASRGVIDPVKDGLNRTPTVANDAYQTYLQNNPDKPDPRAEEHHDDEAGHNGDESHPQPAGESGH